jgi:hypothetical protein
MMAKITTRQPSQIDQEAYERLLEIIEKGTDGAVSRNHAAIVTAPDTIDELLDVLEVIFAAVNDAGKKMSYELAMLSAENVVLNVKYEEVLDVLDEIIDVSYDEALDHATADLMNAFTGSGAADTTADGELVFDERVVLNKSDMKPILREAITRWVELKLQ